MHRWLDLGDDQDEPMDFVKSLHPPRRLRQQWRRANRKTGTWPDPAKSDDPI